MCIRDSRTRVTKLLIRKAFMELLHVKPIQSISIKELCDNAGINRGTFYTHYKDIYDLLEQIEREMLEDFEKALAPLLDTNEREFNPVEISTCLLYTSHPEDVRDLSAKCKNAADNWAVAADRLWNESHGDVEGEEVAK